MKRKGCDGRRMKQKHGYVVDIAKEWRREQAENGERFSFPEPENARGFYNVGFVRKNDCAADFSGWYGIRIALTVKGDALQKRIVRVHVMVETADRRIADAELTVPICGGRVECEVPFTDFPVETVKETYWQFVTAVQVAVYGAEMDPVIASVEGLLAMKRRGIWLELPVKGKSGDPEERVSYSGWVCNCTGKPMEVVLAQEYEGWESLQLELYGKKSQSEQDGTGDRITEGLRKESVAQRTMTLPPFASEAFTAYAVVSNEIPPGGHENSILRAVGRDGSNTYTDRTELKTLRRLPHPYLYHKREGWVQVAEKLRNYPVYEGAWKAYLETAENWQVKPPADHAVYCYETAEENNLMASAYVFAVTGERRYAEKLAMFFRYFANVENGYPARRKGCSQSYVQEGHFFQHLAISYDMICEEGVLTKEEREAVELCFRLYMETLDCHIRSGQISNWLVSEILGGLYCALVLQDMSLALRFVFGNGGLVEQFRHGVLNDGWWHECSVGYNTWVSSMMLHMAHALLPFGYNLIHTRFQIPYNKEVSSSFAGHSSKPLSGMYNQKWGGSQKNDVGIRDMFDATLPFLDERGVLFGIADSDEKKLSAVHFGSTYDLAYTYYQNPEYLPVIKRSQPDPIFGTPELPEYESQLVKESACSDNIGLAMLRSRSGKSAAAAQGASSGSGNRSASDRIQAVLRYGSHGGAHGHFDIGSLLSVMRYGRSFYNPENCWWGYAHFMYKFYVQCSLTKNMVVVDDKMQFPAESRRILFQTGEKLQAAGIEVTTRWCYPPYGGMVYYQDGQKATKEDLRKRCAWNVSFLPIAEGETSPAYGEMSGFTEAVFQRRIMAVTDDYIVLFDYLKGTEEHRFDSLLQIKGFHGIRREDGSELEPVGHTEQFCDNLLSDGQFITDCSWYQADGVTKAAFETVFTKEQAGERQHCDRSNYNEPGILNMDVYTAWPPKTEQMVGRVAIYDGWAAAGDGYTVPLQYCVVGSSAQDEAFDREETDGKGLNGYVTSKGRILAEGSFDGWILGRGEVDVSLEGVEKLVLAIHQGQSHDELGRPVETPQCLFWGSAVLELEDGSCIDIGEVLRRGKNSDRTYHGTKRNEASARICLKNIDTGCGIGRDYKNGRVTIVGTEYPNAIPASPADHNRPGVIQILIKGWNARRFRGCVGVDAFAGEEWQKRKTYAVGARGQEAAFVTVIEPYEGRAMIQKVTAISEDAVKIELANGRVQTVSVEKKKAGTPKVRLTEFESYQNAEVVELATSSRSARTVQ